MTEDDLPPWARAARTGWTWTGVRRPAFAVVPGPGQESVWDYPRPPLLVPDTREVVVLHGKIEVARTRRAYRVLETSHPPTFYLPRADVDITCLAAPSVTSACEWKGLCTSFDVAVAGGRLERAAWSYEQPFPEAKAIAGHVAFYADRLACFVAGERCRPQPGGYYGGWITSELVGPFKGEPNTRGA